MEAHVGLGLSFVISIASYISHVESIRTQPSLLSFQSLLTVPHFALHFALDLRRRSFPPLTLSFGPNFLDDQSWLFIGASQVCATPRVPRLAVGARVACARHAAAEERRAAVVAALCNPSKRDGKRR